MTMLQIPGASQPDDFVLADSVRTTRTDPLRALKVELGLDSDDDSLFQVNRVGYPAWFEADLVELSPTRQYDDVRIMLRVYPRRSNGRRGEMSTDYVFSGPYRPELCAFMSRYLPLLARWFGLDIQNTFLFKKEGGGIVRYQVRPGVGFVS
jgi:hypothetical protein